MVPQAQTASWKELQGCAWSVDSRASALFGTPHLSSDPVSPSPEGCPSPVGEGLDFRQQI